MLVVDSATVGNSGARKRCKIVVVQRQEDGSVGALRAARRQRIRDVRQGPDGLLYLLTDEADRALLRVEPAVTD